MVTRAVSSNDDAVSSGEQKQNARSPTPYRTQRTVSYYSTSFLKKNHFAVNAPHEQTCLQSHKHRGELPHHHTRGMCEHRSWGII